MGCGPVKDSNKGNMHQKQEDHKIEGFPESYEVKQRIQQSEPVIEKTSPPPQASYQLQIQEPILKKPEIQQKESPKENKIPPYLPLENPNTGIIEKKEEPNKELNESAGNNNKISEHQEEYKEHKIVKDEPKVPVKTSKVVNPKPNVISTEQKPQENIKSQEDIKPQENKPTYKASAIPEKKVEVIKPPIFDKSVFKYTTNNHELVEIIRTNLDAYQPAVDVSKYDSITRQYHDYGLKLHNDFNDLINDSRWKFYDKGPSWEGYNMSYEGYISSKSVGYLDGTPIEVN